MLFVLGTLFLAFVSSHAPGGRETGAIGDGVRLDEVRHREERARA